MASSARLDELKKKFEENPRRYFAPYANEHRKQGDLVQAIAICRAHLPNQPGHISGHIVLAQSLHEAQELGEARLVFEQALDLDPENLIALRSLGDIARVQGDLAGARGWFHRVLESDPRNDEVAVILRSLAATDEVHVGPESAPDFSYDPNRTPLSTAVIPAPDSAFAPPARLSAEQASAETNAGDSFAQNDAPSQPDMVSDWSLAGATSAEDEDSIGSVVDGPVTVEAEPFVEETAAFAVPLHELGEFEALAEPSDEPVHAVGEFEALAEPSDDWFAASRPLETESHSILEHAPPAAPPASVDSPAAEFPPDAFELLGQDGEPGADEHPAEDLAFSVAEEDVNGQQPPTADFSTSENDWGEAAGPEQGDNTVAPEPEPVAMELLPQPVDFTEPDLVLAAEVDAPTIQSAPEVWMAEPVADSESVVETAGEFESFSAPASLDEPQAVAESESSVKAGTPSLFVTETMAELYLQQGFTEEALQVYRELLAASPGDATLIARIAMLEGGDAAPFAPAGTSPTVDATPRALDPQSLSVRSFFGRIARKSVRQVPVGSALDTSLLGEQLAHRLGGPSRETPAAGTLAALFGGATVGADDDAAAVRLASVFAPPPSGKPARQADSELSLDHLFRDVPVEPSGAVSLDSFFAAPKSGESEGAFGEQGAQGSDPSGEGPADIEQFTAWLEGLKKK